MNDLKKTVFYIASTVFVIYAAGAVALAASSYPAYNFGFTESGASLWQFFLPASLILPFALFFSNLQSKKIGAVSIISAFVFSLAVAAAPVIFRTSEGLDGAFFVGGAVMFFGAFAVGNIISDQTEGFFEKHKAVSIGLTLAGLLTLALTALYLLYFIIRGILPNIALVFALLPLDAGMLLILLPKRIKRLPLALCCLSVTVCTVFAVLYLSYGAYISLGCLAAALIYTAADRIINK